VLLVLTSSHDDMKRLYRWEFFFELLIWPIVMQAKQKLKFNRLSKAKQTKEQNGKWNAKMNTKCNLN
jgi:hypothetical protein